MLYQELQGLVMSWWKLPQQVLDLEEDPVELHADLSRGHRGGAEPRCLHFLHKDTLAFLGQTNEVVIETEQDERLRKLPGKTWREKKNTQSYLNREVNNTMKKN